MIEKHKKVLRVLTPFSMSLFGDDHGWGYQKSSPCLKSVTHILSLLLLLLLILYFKLVGYK